MLATPSIVMLLEFGRWPFTVKRRRRRRFPPGLSREHAGHASREVEQHPPVVGDVGERLVLERERPLAAGRLQLADAARDRHFLGHRPDVERQGAGRQAIVGVDDEVGPLQRLEALEGGLEGIGVGPHDREEEPALGIRHRSQDVPLGVAGQRDRHPRQHPSLAVGHRSRDGGARRLCLDGRRVSHEDQAHRGQSQNHTQHSHEGHRSSPSGHDRVASEFDTVWGKS